MGREHPGETERPGSAAPADPERLLAGVRVMGASYGCELWHQLGTERVWQQRLPGVLFYDSASTSKERWKSPAGPVQAGGAFRVPRWWIYLDCEAAGLPSVFFGAF